MSAESKPASRTAFPVSMQVFLVQLELLLNVIIRLPFHNRKREPVTGLETTTPAANRPSANGPSLPQSTLLHARMAQLTLEHPLIGADQVPRRLAKDGAPTILHSAPQVFVAPSPAAR
jgi:hypothetical protein